ncbi:MAG: hypothetical protein NTV22_20395 [bacterium]|nr:hypothetical protein [bacterium]
MAGLQAGARGHNWHDNKQALSLVNSSLADEFSRRGTPQEKTKHFNRHFLSIVAVPIKRGAEALRILPQHSGHEKTQKSIESDRGSAITYQFLTPALLLIRKDHTIKIGANDEANTIPIIDPKCETIKSDPLLRKASDRRTPKYII